MAKKEVIESFSIANTDLRKLAGGKSHIFTNDDFSMVVNGGPMRGKLLRQGQIYNVLEGRILMVLEGEADVSLNLEDYHFGKGTVVVTTPDIIMELKRCSEETDLIGIVYKEDIHISENIIVQTDATQWNELLRMANLLWDLAHHTPFRQETINHMLRALISNIASIKSEKETTERSVIPSRQQQLFQSFKTLVNQHCERERTIPFYADQLHITPHHLSAVIKRVSGHSVMYWVNRAVILRAKVLLKTSGMMSYEVADRLNFISSSAFNNYFKRETGMTPKEFQNN